MQQVESAPPSGYEDLLTIHYARVDETAPTAFNGNQRALLSPAHITECKPASSIALGTIS
ncbi:hypothetical protein ABBQ32_008746 [Trebouxia sp. C0010 RCD-2024]